VTAKAIFSKLPYDPEKDLAAICMLARLPQVFVIAAEVHVKDLREFIAHAKSTSCPTAASAQAHPVISSWKRCAAAGIDITHVPYRGFPQATVDLIGNRIQAMICPLPSSVTGLAKEGKLKILAGTSGTRSPLAPEFPTLAEAGLPGVPSLAWNGLFGPSSMPTDLVQRLAVEAGKAMTDPDVKAAMAAAGIETVAETPESFRSFLAAERQRWVPVVQRLGIRKDG
jgi:tripartite-type tricarboxylate transporter receptor subunit TctC